MKSLQFIEVDTPEFSGTNPGEKEVIAGSVGVEYDFETGSAFSWTATNATNTPSADGLIHTTTATDPQLNSPAISIPGAIARYIEVDVERTALRTSGIWAGEVYYQTSGHGQSGSFSNRFPELENVIGARRTYVIDMHDLFTGGTDWADNTITQFRLDFDQNTGGAFLVHSIKVGSRDQTWRFAVPTDYLPRNVDCIPSVSAISLTPLTMSLGQDLGQRATLTITLKDHRHIMDGEPFDQGTFWGKWRARFGQKLRGRKVRWINGLEGQALESMPTRHFFIDSTDGPSPDGTYTIVCKDLLKFADDDRALAPRLSNGSLAGGINNAVTAATLNPAGIGNAEYPASGHICLGGKEVVSFTRSGDSLTITRAQLGTTAQAHNAGDRAQLVLNYDGDDAADIIADLFINYANIDSSYIPLADWQAKTAANLGAVIYARAITEPTPVNKLVTQLIEQAGLCVWWNDSAQIIRLLALKEIATDADTFDEEVILEKSLKVKEQPDKRISQIWTYYGQRNPADRGDDEDNYRAALATVDLERETEYGSPLIRTIKGQWLATENAAQRLNQIQLSRFRDPPRRFNFDLFPGTQINIGAGYRLRWRQNQDILGNIVQAGAPIQIVRLAVEAGVIHIEAEEMLASGVIVLTHTVILTDTGSVLEWEVHPTFNNADNSIHCIGAGGGGARTGSTGGKAGGGGAYAAITNLDLSGSPGVVQYRVGAGGQFGSGAQSPTAGGDTWFDGADFAAASVGARGGQQGSGQTGLGQGGQAASSTGTVKFNGGNGGSGGSAFGGGGGAGAAAGPNGNGGNGGTGVTGNAQSGCGGGGGGADGGTNGGNGSGGDVSGAGVGGNNRFGSGGGVPGTPHGIDGGGGCSNGEFDGSGEVGRGSAFEQWTQTIAPIFSGGPAGGSAGGGERSSGQHAENYGAGGGGSGGRGSRGGNGSQGLIVITWTVA
jgi:hypothetical protein